MIAQLRDFVCRSMLARLAGKSEHVGGNDLTLRISQRQVLVILAASLTGWIVRCCWGSRGGGVKPWV